MLRIGALGKRVGVSAKALRLYEAEGLLKPDSHSPAGYRLYGASAMRRLSQLLLLRRAGFPLRQIRALLAGGEVDLPALVDAQIASLHQRLAQASDELALLQRLRTHLATTETLEQLTECMQMTQKLEVPLSPDERAAFARRAQEIGPAAIAAAEQAWPVLIGKVRAAIASGLAPDAPAVQPLAREWHDLVKAATGGDAAVERKIAGAWQAQPQAMAAFGMDGAMFAWIGQAIRAAGLAPG